MAAAVGGLSGLGPLTHLGPRGVGRGLSSGGTAMGGIFRQCDLSNREFDPTTLQGDSCR